MISLLIVTHEKLGEAYRALAEHFFPNGDMENIQILGVEPNFDHYDIISRIENLLPKLNVGNGVLILTDIFGATPCNAALKVLRSERSALVTGLNAPMLIKAVSYRAQCTNLPEFAELVKQAGVNGIMTFVEPLN